MWGNTARGAENSDYRPIQNSGGDLEDKEERPIINATKSRKKDIPLEVELDLSGKFSMGDMIKPGSEGEKEAHTIAVGNFKQKGDLGMYGKLADYGEFQGYDLGIDTDLSQIGEKIYANFHKPSWKAAKHHLLTV